MGIILDEKCYLYGSCKCQTAVCVVRPDNGCPVYRYFKDLIVKDYENRLKADIVDALEDLKKEIEKIEIGNNVPFGFEPVNKFYEGVSASSRVVQEKINKLKGEEDGNDD
jgi:hypothetical protein